MGRNCFGASTVQIMVNNSREISKIDATRCQILKLNAPNSISAGAPPQTHWGDYSVAPDPYLDLRGLLLRKSKGKEGKGKGGEGILWQCEYVFGNFCMSLNSRARGDGTELAIDQERVNRMTALTGAI